MESRYSTNLLNDYRRLFKMPNGYGEDYVKKDIIPFVTNLVKEESKNKHLDEKLEFGEFQMGVDAIFSTVSVDKNLFYFKFNEKGLNSDYSGFGQGLHYDGNSKVKKDIRLAQIISSALHEVQHAQQFNLTYGDTLLDISPKSILYAKEFLVADTDYKWYYANHELFYIEKEAELEGYRKTAEFVEKAMPNSDFCLRCKRQYESAEKNFKPVFDSYFENKDNIPMVHRIDEKLSQLPPQTIIKARQKYLALRLIYNENGTKKTLEEIQEMKQFWLNKYNNHTEDVIVVDGKKTTIMDHIDSVVDMIIRSDKELCASVKKDKDEEMEI